MKKLLIISSRFPYPLEKGDKLRLYHQIRSLSSYFEIKLVALSDESIDKSSYDELYKYCSSICVLKNNGKLNVLKALLSRDAFQLSYFYSKRNHRRIQEEHDAFNPDIIFYQLFRTSKYSLKSDSVKVMDLMDCFSYGYMRRSEESSGMKSQFYRMESKRIKANEKNLGSKFNAYTIISKQDADRIELQDPIEILPNGIDVDYFSPIENSIPEYDLLFVGNLGYEPNIYAVNYLYEQINPLIKPLGLKINISGARPGKLIQSYNSEQFRVHGWLDDIRDAYSSSEVFIAPIFGGIGQQNKVLEAMSMGLACIVSPEVAEGLDIPNVEEYISVARSPEEFLDHIKLACIERKESYHLKAKKARKYLEEHRTWDAINQKFAHFIESLTN